MLKYDLYAPTGKIREPIPKCKHNTKKNPSEPLITEYLPEISEWVIEHGQSGYYIQGFCGRYGISEDAMTSWLSDKTNKYEDFKNAFYASISAAIFYWNEELINAINHVHIASDTIPIIKGVLVDIIKSSKEFQFKNLEVETPEEAANRKALKSQIELQSAFLGSNKVA